MQVKLWARTPYTGGGKGGKDACQGDSGGPLVVYDGQYFQPWLDKIKTFRDHSWNFSKLSVKVRKLQQQNLQGKWNQIYFVFNIEIATIVRIIQMVSNNMFVSVTDTLFPSKSKQKRKKLK